MINITDFSKWIQELVGIVNMDAQQIDDTILAVMEEHAIKKLKDKRGVILCVMYPDIDAEGEQDAEMDDHNVVLFLVQKVPHGSLSDAEEVEHYSAMQSIMQDLRNAIRDTVECGCAAVVAGNKYRIEWEYQIFGGFNGLSMSFQLTDRKYD